MPDSNPQIHIDGPLLRQKVLTYLRSDVGKSTLEMFDITFVDCLLITAVTLVMGICLLPTIVFTLVAIKCLWSVLTLEAFASLGKKLSDQPEKIVPLIMHGIIIGPDRKHALALGTFMPPEQYSATWLARKAELFASIYANRDVGADAQYDELRTILRDDTFRSDRRRRVPARFAEGKDLLLFDIVIDTTETMATADGDVLHSFVGEYGPPEDRGEKGSIQRIPWGVVSEAVQFGPKLPRAKLLHLANSGANETFDAEVVEAETFTAEAVPSKPLPWIKVSLVLLAIIAFCGLGGFVIRSGKQDDADKLAAEMGNHPVVVEQLGGIEECSYSFIGSLNEGRKRHVYDVRGPKDSGQIVTREFLFTVISTKLRTSAGEWELLDEELNPAPGDPAEE
ncbi:hypothetical protein NA78x_004969 [Anatilimnocola sp. NA78]|uniref:hypothetical protein n=1 Tax=Anatilimnocola sp. NA78 TaxID=3415683 RepID=UPI003CE4B8EC